MIALLAGIFVALLLLRSFSNHCLAALDLGAGVEQCCDRKSQAACAQSFAPWQQATIEIMLAISLRVR